MEKLKNKKTLKRTNPLFFRLKISGVFNVRIMGLENLPVTIM
jgi:hypothetical protein